MKPPTNLTALIAVGGWNLSKAFLSAKAKAQARDSKGRFIPMGGMVRWMTGNGWRWGFVSGISSDGKNVTVTAHDGKSYTVLPKSVEVVKALIPDTPAEAKQLSDAMANVKKGFPATAPSLGGAPKAKYDLAKVKTAPAGNHLASQAKKGDVFTPSNGPNSTKAYVAAGDYDKNNESLPVQEIKSDGSLGAVEAYKQSPIGGADHPNSIKKVSYPEAVKTYEPAKPVNAANATTTPRPSAHLVPGDLIKRPDGSVWRVTDSFVGAGSPAIGNKYGWGAKYGTVGIENVETGVKAKLQGADKDKNFKSERFDNPNDVWGGGNATIPMSEEEASKLADKMAPVDKPHDEDPLLYVDTDGFKKVGGQSGSNPGGIYEDPATGDKYYVKKAQTEQHAANEVLAAHLYQQAGIATPEVYLTEFPDSGGPAVASKIVPDLKPMFPNGQTTPDKLSKAREGFAMDAWLANWDSIGLGYDNLMMDKDGNPIRVDTGGALIYRAQGSPKGGLFGDTVGETETLRNSSMNAQAAKIFGGMSDDDIGKAVAATVNKVSDKDVDALIDELPFSSDAVRTDLKAKLKARKADLNSKFNVPSEPQPAPATQPAPEGTGKMIGAKEFNPFMLVKDKNGKTWQVDLDKKTLTSGSAKRLAYDKEQFEVVHDPGPAPIMENDGPLPAAPAAPSAPSAGLDAPNKSLASKPVQDFKPGDVLAPVGSKVTSTIVDVKPTGDGQYEVTWNKSNNDTPQSHVFEGDDTSSFGTLVHGAQTDATPQAPVDPPAPPPVDPPAAPSAPDEDPSGKGVGAIGAKVTHTSGETGTVVKINPNSGYSLVQSEDGSKKLWKAWSKLEPAKGEDNSTPFAEEEAKPATPTTPEQDAAFLTDALGAPANPDDINSAVVKLGQVLPEGGDEVPPLQDALIQKLVDNQKLEPGEWNTLNDYFDTLQSEHDKETSNKIWNAWKDLQTAAGQTGGMQAKEPDGDGSTDLTDQIPPSPTPPAYDVTYPSMLAVGDKVFANGQVATISNKFPGSDGSTVVLGKHEDGSLFAATYDPDQPVSAVDVAALKSDTPSAPLTTTAGVKVGDKVIPPDSLGTYTVSAIAQDPVSGNWNVTLEHDSGFDTPGVYLPDEHWQVLPSAPAAPKIETLQEPPSEPTYTKAAAGDLKVGDKIVDIDGEKGTITAVSTNPTTYKKKISYSTTDNHDYTFDFAPDDESWFQKLDAPSGTQAEPDAAPEPAAPAAKDVKSYKDGDKVLWNGKPATVDTSEPSSYPEYGDWFMAVTFDDTTFDSGWVSNNPDGSVKFNDDGESGADKSITLSPADAAPSQTLAPDALIETASLKPGMKVTTTTGTNAATITEVTPMADGKIHVGYTFDNGHETFLNLYPSDTLFKSVGPTDAPATPSPTAEASTKKVGETITPAELTPGMTISTSGGNLYTINGAKPAPNGKVELNMTNQATGEVFPSHKVDAGHDGWTLTALPAGSPEASPESVPEPPASAVPTGTLVPGSAHVMQDAQGQYVVTKSGEVLRPGDKVTGAKGFSGTIVGFELNAKYAKVKSDADGKTKARQIDTLTTSPGAETPAAPAAPATPSTPASDVNNVNTPGAPDPKVADKTYMSSGSTSAPNFKPGDVVGKNKQVVEYSKASTKVPGKWEVKFTDQAEPLTISKNNPWETWKETFPGVTGTKSPADFAVGDIVSETGTGEKKKVKLLDSFGGAGGELEVLFEGDSDWTPISNPDSPWYQFSSLDAPSAPSAPSAPGAAPEPAGPVQISHDPVDFNFPEGGTVSVPASGKIVKPQWWSHGMPAMRDGWGNQWTVNPATGELTKKNWPDSYWNSVNPDDYVFESSNPADVKHKLGEIFSPDEFVDFNSKIDSKIASESDSYYSNKASLTALKKILNNPDDDSITDQDFALALSAATYNTLVGWDDAEQYGRLRLELTKLQKEKTGAYRGEWRTSLASNGQYHYDANQRKALSALGLSPDAEGFVTSKFSAPASNPSAAAEIHAMVSDPSRAAVIDNLFGKGTAEAIARKTRGNQFLPALSDNSSPYAKEVPGLPSAEGKNGTIVYLGDNVIASDGQGGQVVLVTADQKLRVRRSDGTHFTRKATAFVVTGSPVDSTKPHAAQTAEAAPYKPKPRPEFSIPDWSAGNVGNVDSVQSVLDRIKQSGEAGNVGWSFASDGDQIEDMDVHVSRVLSKSGQELIELKFKLTPKQGNAMFKRHSADPDWTESSIALDKRQTTEYSKLAQLTGTSVYSGHNGFTLKRDKSDGTQIRFHRAKSTDMNSSKHNPVAYHNLVQIRIPADATPSDIAKAMYDAGVDDPGPAKPAAVRRLAENKALSLFAKKTNAWTGNDAIKDPTRSQLIEKIEKDWDFKIDDIEVAQGANGRVELLLPQSVADKIRAKTKVNYFGHQLYGGETDLHTLIGKNPFQALLSTSVRDNEGVITPGQSKTADVHTGGADYIFTRPRGSMGPQLSNQLVFDSSRLFRRMDWFGRNTDAYGKRGPSMDIIGELHPGSTEAMFKQRLNLDDAMGYFVSSESHRQDLIKKIKDAGISHFGSRTVDEFIVVASPTPQVTPVDAPETVPISSLGDVTPTAEATPDLGGVPV